jgi:hypothetical protein
VKLVVILICDIIPLLLFIAAVSTANNVNDVGDELSDRYVGELQRAVDNDQNEDRYGDVAGETRCKRTTNNSP